MIQDTVEVGTHSVIKGEMLSTSKGTTTVVPVERSTGVRQMRVVFLARLSTYLRSAGFEDVAPYVDHWLPDKERKPLAVKAAKAMLEQLNASMAAASRAKDAAYLEAAIFCLEATATSVGDV